MKWLSDATLKHLCRLTDEPDLRGTRYELVEKLGQGGMGTVYLARDRELDRPLALKVLDASPDHADAQARMVREARITARLEHPSIVPVHDAGALPDGRFYYAMKLVRGQRLDACLPDSLPLTERLQLFRKICDAVAFAHAHGVLHRDLKPQNIMLGSFGEVLVLDWGIAKDLGERRETPANTEKCEHQSPHQTGSGAVLGTPGYMAPEQEAGESGAVDERADVYALGAILYFLLTGQAPLKTSLGVTPPRRLSRSIPRPLEAVCLKALAADRAARYDHVTNLSDDVAGYLAGWRVKAYPERLLEAGLRLILKYRAVVALLLAYLMMRILLLIFFRA